MPIDLTSDLGHNWSTGAVMTEPPYATLELLKTICVLLNVAEAGGSVYPELKRQLQNGLLNSLSELGLLSDVNNYEVIADIENSIMMEREGLNWKRSYRRS